MHGEAMCGARHGNQHMELNSVGKSSLVHMESSSYAGRMGPEIISALSQEELGLGLISITPKLIQDAYVPRYFQFGEKHGSPRHARLAPRRPARKQGRGGGSIHEDAGR